MDPAGELPFDSYHTACNNCVCVCLGTTVTGIMRKNVKMHETNKQ